MSPVQFGYYTVTGTPGTSYCKSKKTLKKEKIDGAALAPGLECVLALASGTPRTTVAPGTSIHQRSSDQTFEGAAAIAAE